MPVELGSALAFPDVRRATEEGLLAYGGDLRPERLLLAYREGVFPWPTRGMPLLWFSPDPRFVLPLDQVHVGRSLRKQVRRGGFEIRVDTAFAQVIDACRRARRPGQRGTWITAEMARSYTTLHTFGHAHSIECWVEGALVGGLYGVAVGNAFCGESMFAERPDASKLAFATLLGQLLAWGFDFVDCQVHTEHLERFGAVEMPREAFLRRLAQAREGPARVGRWSLELDPTSAVDRLPGG